jgi:Fe-S-cluster containining protein
VETYYTFVDGALRYDCPSCGQHCCRGRGWALGANELIPLLRKAPEVAPHLFVRGGETFGAIDFTDGCWFLQKDGNCRVEVEHGRALKPSTCRLFPFNRVYRVGDVRVVDVNTVLCPLQHAPGRGVTWAELDRELEGAAGSPLIDVPASKPLQLPDDWLAIERRVFDACRAHAADLPALTRASGDADTDEIVASWSRTYGVDGAEYARLEAQVAPLVALLVPSLRWNTLFKKDAGNYDHVAPRLPRRIRALGFLGAMALRARGAMPSLRDLTELCQMQLGALEVLSSWREPVQVVRPNFDADIPESMRAPLGVLMAGAFRGGKTLGDLVEAAAATLDPVARPLAVSLAAVQMPTLFPMGV